MCKLIGFCLVSLSFNKATLGIEQITWLDLEYIEFISNLPIIGL